MFVKDIESSVSQSPSLLQH